jgi:hypothetical protein
MTLGLKAQPPDWAAWSFGSVAEGREGNLLIAFSVDGK